MIIKSVSHKLIFSLQVMEFPAYIKKDPSLSHRKPGRRSQPRSSEDEGGIPCEECGKEFRYLITQVYLKYIQDVT